MQNAYKHGLIEEAIEKNCITVPNMQKLDVKVKWSGKIYELELDLDDTSEVFKHQLYSLTGVEPERQKIIGKGRYKFEKFGS
ncbi:673_t:CDS:2 [Diversispora eburnea]|uniref:673_t:CDS:1 n=1 Tax=Diversispora eburnea TaxID=1213867 RepID=A0A9N9FHL7_9GLOM|nr:673_t:CDS:2 [Diversispora eburnea]